ncbi:TetR/AcrR family transcriptional regulator [Streptosporangium carneum]|uniref:TetR family transcriptional regulator n=1 Tax=Streptosporangium carneum TaxID=47481 RepID=A0A9W6I0F4_9ACTN|nr:helix-turn-helix domain-containing protein [Streptosporangium carneum]GLK08749.1 TetR family transcriptional regulator [Streptosporangium carneum]
MVKATETPTSAEPAMRADARRNRDRVLAAARTVFSEQGTDASLRDVARRAGVGIGTLYRHFPTREALLEALIGHGFDRLCAAADELLTAPSPGDALTTWLHDFAVGSATYRGLPASVMSGVQDEGSELHRSCVSMRAAAARLLTRAQEAGAVRSDLVIEELLTLGAAIAWANEQIPGRANLTDRLLSLTMQGIQHRQ